MGVCFVTRHVINRRAPFIPFALNNLIVVLGATENTHIHLDSLQFHSLRLPDVSVMYLFSTARVTLRQVETHNAMHAVPHVNVQPFVWVISRQEETTTTTRTSRLEFISNLTKETIFCAEWVAHTRQAQRTGPSVLGLGVGFGEGSCGDIVYKEKGRAWSRKLCVAKP